MADTATQPYGLHLWLKTHCYPGTDTRLKYRDVAARAKMSHVTLYAFNVDHEPTDQQRADILLALADLGFKVKERDLW